MITDEQILGAKSRLEGAFRPLRCKAQDWDYMAKMQFKVVDENGSIIFEAKIAERDVVDASRFVDVIEQAKAAMQDQGFVLA